MINSVDKELDKMKKFQEKNNISDEEIDNLYDEIYASLDSNLSENQKQIRTLRKIRGLFRRRANTTGVKTNGIIIGRFRDSDYNKYAYKQVQEYVDNNGIEKAKLAGLVNEKGQYLHTGQFNKGQVIDVKKIFGNAVGIFQDNDGNPEGHFLSIGSFQIEDKIPLGQEIELNYKAAQKNGNLFSNNKLYYYNSAVVNNSNYMFTLEELNNYIELIDDMFGKEYNIDKVVFEDYDEMITTIQDSNITDNKYNLVGLCVDIIDIGVRDNPEDRIPIVAEAGYDSFSFWSEPYIFRGLNIQEGISGVILLNAYKGKDSIGFNVAGFLPLSDDI